ncbi:MAG: UbiA prenyltransferase family protein [Planctomycetia bacterium]|nr:UbiA prenyltransferase family protein [Planctomycetia bacterium]
MFSVFQLLRPRQWCKNVFVLIPLLFSGVLERDEFFSSVGMAWLAFICFCSWSSAVYILNDICDREKDRKHPRKKNRPLAAGKVSVSVAACLGFFLAVLPFTGTLFGAVPFWFWVSGIFYLLNNIFYSFLFRHQVLLDVFSISIGFVLRLLGGCVVLGVTPSQWIVICGFTLALFLGFGKRRMEIRDVSQQDSVQEGYRLSLMHYSREFLDLLLGVSLSMCLITYMLYTMASETVEVHQTKNLIYTVPFVFYGTFHYLWVSLHGR